MKQVEYKEGPDAAKRFEEAMKSVFQAPPTVNPKKKPPKKKAATSRKSKNSDKD